MQIFNSNFVGESDFSSYLTELDQGFNFGNRLISRAYQSCFNLDDAALTNRPNDFKSSGPVLLNVQDHLRPELFPKLRSMIETLSDSEVIIANIGTNMFANTPNFVMDESVISFLQGVQSKYPIGVRGQTTANVLRTYGINNLEINGCPTFWSLGMDMEAVEEKANKNREKFKVNQLKILIGGDYVPQFTHPFGYLCQGDYDRELCEGLLELGLVEKTSFGYLGENLTFKMNNWTQNLNASQIYIPIEPNSDLFESINEYDLYVGSRVHGCITALNSGVPAVNTNYDFRALEMCQYLNIPHISQFPGFSITEGWLETLANCYEVSAREYDEGLHRFNAYCEDIKTATKH